MPLLAPPGRPACLGARLALVAVPLLVAGRAHADIRFYSSRADFQKAASNLFTIGFEGIAPPNGIAAVTSSTPPNDADFLFEATNGTLDVVDGNYYKATTGTGFNLGSGAFLQVSGGNPAQLFVAGNGGLYAGGFDLATGDTNPASQIQIALGNQATANVVAPQNAPAFFGFVSTNYVSSLTFTASGGSENSKLFMDNFQYTFFPVPEMPVSTGMGVMAACGLLLLRRARRNRAEVE